MAEVLRNRTKVRTSAFGMKDSIADQLSQRVSHCKAAADVPRVKHAPFACSRCAKEFREEPSLEMHFAGRHRDAFEEFLEAALQHPSKARRARTGSSESCATGASLTDLVLAELRPIDAGSALGQTDSQQQATMRPEVDEPDARRQLEMLLDLRSRVRRLQLTSAQFVSRQDCGIEESSTNRDLPQSVGDSQSESETCVQEAEDSQSDSGAECKSRVDNKSRAESPPAKSAELHEPQLGSRDSSHEEGASNNATISRSAVDDCANETEASAPRQATEAALSSPRGSAPQSSAEISGARECVIECSAAQQRRASDSRSSGRAPLEDASERKAAPTEPAVSDYATSRESQLQNGLQQSANSGDLHTKAAQQTKADESEIEPRNGFARKPTAKRREEEECKSQIGDSSSLQKSAKKCESNSSSLSSHLNFGSADSNLNSSANAQNATDLAPSDEPRTQRRDFETKNDVCESLCEPDFAARSNWRRDSQPEVAQSARGADSISAARSESPRNAAPVGEARDSSSDAIPGKIRRPDSNSRRLFSF